MPDSAPSIVIIGAGFSGSLLALHLLKQGPPDLRISLIERQAGFGRGLAYSAQNPRHLLNVRVGNMSAWPGDPGHLTRWLAETEGHAGADLAFITRETYGRYIASMLQAAMAGPDGAQRLQLEHDEAVRVAPAEAGRLAVTLAMGRTLETDVAVLALGNLPPSTPHGLGLEALAPGLYAADPWAEGALEGLAPDAPVLLLGSGLTMIDVALGLEAHGHGGVAHGLSRRGLAPRRHTGLVKPHTAPSQPIGAPLSRRLALVRRRTREVGWRQAVDEVRASLHSLWRQASPAEQRRFLRHLRPWWDMHRHRMAPAVADWFDARRAAGRLKLGAGRILGVTLADDGVTVTWKPRGQREPKTLHVARIINCTGPGGDPAAASAPLIRGLFADGAVRAHPLGLGLDVTGEGQAIDAAGRAEAPLYAVGPLTRGAHWEITAVPDIRNQVADLAERLVRHPSLRARGKAAVAEDGR